MPLFILHALDRPETLELRMEHYAAHRAYVEDQEALGVGLFLSGPLQSDDGEVMTGSLLILDVPDRAVAEAFAANDPFMLRGVWGQVRIDRLLPRRVPK